VYDVDSCQDDDDECLGFASLPEQVHRKAVKRGFDFTVMVVGSSRLPVSRFPLLQFGAAFSSPAFFWPCIFDRRALSSLAFSVPRPFYSLLALPHSMRSRVYVTVGRPSVRPSVRLSVCPIVRQPVRRVAGLLLSAVRAGDVDRQRRAPAPSSSGAAARAAARRSAANAGSVMSTAELTRLTQTCQLYNKGAYMSIIRLTSVILCNFSFF